MGLEVVPQHVLPHHLSFLQHIPPVTISRSPPMALYPDGQQTKTPPPAKLTVRSGGQHVRLPPREVGTVPFGFPTCAQTSPLLQQMVLPSSDAHALVPLGQHLALPPYPAQVSLLRQQSPTRGSQQVLPRAQHFFPHGCDPESHWAQMLRLELMHFWPRGQH